MNQKTHNNFLIIVSFHPFLSSFILVQFHKSVLPSQFNTSVSSLQYGKDESNSLSHNSHIQKQNEDATQTNNRVNKQFLTIHLIILYQFYI